MPHNKKDTLSTHRPKIILSAGGTGGHVFPATACASILNDMDCDLILYTDTRGQKWSGILGQLPTYSVQSSSVLGRGLKSKVFAGISIIKGFFQARAHLKKSDADIIVGFGGYATVPTILAGASLGIKIVLHEQNAFAGRANRILSRFSTSIATAFHNPIGLPSHKCIHTGNPVRADIRDAYAPYTLPNDDVFTILITGGSQGAEIFGIIIPEAMKKYKGRVKIIQQVRENQVETVEAIYAEAGIDVIITPFITDMASTMAQAHYAIGRSGAGSVMENACAGLPSLLVPYKYAADNHQYHNAKALENAGGCTIISQKDLTVEKIHSILDVHFAKKNGNLLKNMAQKAYEFSTPNADKKLADVILKEVSK